MNTCFRTSNGCIAETEAHLDGMRRSISERWLNELSGSFVARSFRAEREGKPTKPFHYFNKGDLAVIGRAAAVANVFGVHLSGFPAWLVWLFIHLMYIVEFQSRILVFVEWGFLYLTWNRGARLITGTAASESGPNSDRSLTL
ncbi:MAG: hypothetical protein M3Y72_07475 [Acidobacteriota bacterium]|nr:hypothetical protein [Acidobacteriota bacterium]